ncbi:hypothetical protein [Azospirillum agricola]|uniref:hypothetical protein n=1 Tax=Azospirillum agricola TaxID=1720247 RepID=UPI000A0F131C|nr:hypothetical protein [Azospirillum agricola]SMH62836.1 hypothetical protein SAMN02982994_6659 [Azospirillum lipoferum]
MSDVWAAKIDLTRPNGTAETLFLGDGAVLPLPHDDPDHPNMAIRQRLDGPPSYATGVSADLSTLAADVGAGQLRLLNGDGALSYLAGCAIGAIEVRRGRDGLWWRDWDPVMRGRGETAQPALSRQQARRTTIDIYDLRAALDDAVETRTYGGTNAGAVGYDGTPEAGKGNTVPLCLGEPPNVSAILVNSISRAFQWDAGPADGMTAFWDGGAAAGMGFVATSSGAGFDTATLSATQYAVDTPRGLIRLGGTLGNEITFTPRGRRDAGGTYIATAPHAIRWALGKRGAGTIGATLTAWANAAPIGAWWPGEVRYREVIDLMQRSAGGVAVPDALGAWQAVVIDVPGAPAMTITEGQVLDIGVDDPSLAVPAWKVTIKGRRNHRTLTRSSQATSVRDTDRGRWLTDEWRQAVASAPSTQARWPDARPIEIETALTSQTDMEALAARLLSVLGPRADNTPRRSLWIAVEATAARLALPLGKTILLDYPPEGMADPLVYVGCKLASPRRHLMTMRLFG